VKKDTQTAPPREFRPQIKFLVFYSLAAEQYMHSGHLVVENRNQYLRMSQKTANREVLPMAAI